VVSDWLERGLLARLSINLRTAKQLNLTLPELALVGADKIIE
jgi:hypothetical protein